QDVWIENEIAGWKSQPLRQQPIGAFADFNLALEGVGLAVFIKRHDYDRRSALPNKSSLSEKFLIPRLELSRVDHPFALDAAETGFDHTPFRAVDHDRDPGNIGLAADQTKEASHRRLRIDHSFIHVDVEQVGSAFDLLARHLERTL